MRYIYPFGRRRAARPATAALMLAASLAVSSLQSTPVHAQEVDSALAAKFQKVIVDLRTSSNGVVGLSAAVAMPDGRRWEGATGLSGAVIPVTPEMLQGIGSITKTYVAALTLKLAEEGRLSLDDSLHRWLPAYPNIDSNVTIRQLLNHTSGIYNYLDNTAVNDSLVADLYRIWTPEEVLTSFVNPRRFAPGQGWGYSNTGYVLLGMIANRITGNTIGADIRSRLLAPHGLHHTFFPIDEEPIEPIADPWSDLTGDGVPENIAYIPRDAIHSTAWAAGAMFATPADLVSWGGALYGGQVLSPASLQQMLTFRAVSFGFSNGYGLGVMRFRMGTRTLYGHGGNVLGYGSILLYSPEDSITVSAIVNVTGDATVAGLELMQMAINNKVAGVQAGRSETRGISGATGRREPGAVVVDYTLGGTGRVKVALHNLLGGEVASVTEDQEAGPHSIRFNTSGLPSGAYFYRLTSGDRSATGKVVL